MGRRNAGLGTSDLPWGVSLFTPTGANLHIGCCKRFYPLAQHDTRHANHPAPPIANPTFCDRVRARKKPGKSFFIIKKQ